MEDCMMDVARALRDNKSYKLVIWEFDALKNIIHEFIAYTIAISNCQQRTNRQAR
jgi:hypothetical protein